MIGLFIFNKFSRQITISC